MRPLISLIVSPRHAKQYTSSLISLHSQAAGVFGTFGDLPTSLTLSRPDDTKAIMGLIDRALDLSDLPSGDRELMQKLHAQLKYAALKLIEVAARSGIVTENNPLEAVAVLAPDDDDLDVPFGLSLLTEERRIYLMEVEEGSELEKARETWRCPEWDVSLPLLPSEIVDDELQDLIPSLIEGKKEVGGEDPLEYTERAAIAIAEHLNAALPSIPGLTSARFISFAASSYSPTDLEEMGKMIPLERRRRAELPEGMFDV